MCTKYLSKREVPCWPWLYWDSLQEDSGYFCIPLSLVIPKPVKVYWFTLGLFLQHIYWTIKPQIKNMKNFSFCCEKPAGKRHPLDAFFYPQRLVCILNPEWMCLQSPFRMISKVKDTLKGVVIQGRDRERVRSEVSKSWYVSLYPSHMPCGRSAAL